MHGCRFVLILWAALVAGPGLAQGGDPLDSPACRRALDALRTQEDQARADAPGQDRRQTAARLEPLRRAAARACLGARGDPPPAPRRLAQPPVEVPRVPLPQAAVPVPAGPPVPVPKPPAPPVVVTTCDAAGCWASDGSRLQRFGTNLLGPRGVCAVQGVVLHCP